MRALHVDFCSRPFIISCVTHATDTEGVEFNIADEKFRVFKAGQILRIAPLKTQKAIIELVARPVVCDSTQVCTRLGGEEFSCDAQLCQAKTHALLPEDRLALCLAGTGIYEPSSLQKKRMTLARSCRAPCTVPHNCRQP